ncbi:MAG TPA: shikimate kinase [Pirellulales bacterium]|nr:shikimate kinase [Pirellulales bacterium]
MNVVLIGYRGTGKSTVARQLGLEIGWDWVDADVEVELRAGKSIAAIFSDEGEGAFRDLESEVLGSLVARDRTVIAAGGGVVLREANRQQLAGCGHVVWLRASPSAILRRIAACATTAGRRPNLTTSGGEAEVVRLLAERTPLYHECADLEIDTEDKSPAEIAGEIIRQLHLSLPKEFA